MSNENQTLAPNQDTPLPANDLKETPVLIPAKEFPSKPDEDGFFYESEDDQESEILTKVYENGSKVQKVTLSNGKIATIRMLKGRDMVKTKSMVPAYKNTDIDFETINLSVAVKIDGNVMPPEFFMDDLLQMDYATLFNSYAMLNFQSGRSISHG